MKYLSSFDYDVFYGDYWEPSSFVVSAKKYSKEQAIELFEQETCLSVNDIKEGWCANRCVYNDDGERVCGYMLVKKGSRGSFPVWVIDYKVLKEEQK